MTKYLFFISIVLFSCHPADDLFTSYGEVINEERQVPNFDAIEVGEKFDVFIIQDSIKAGTVIMSAGKNVIKGYTTVVENNLLKIRNENSFNWVRKLKIRQKVIVYVSTLNRIEILGSAKIISEGPIVNKQSITINQGGLEDAELTIEADYININCNNTGGVILSGSCFLISASVDDISFLDARNLLAKKCYIASFSRADSYVKGLEVLDIKLFGAGNIHYSGEPSQTFIKFNSGEGKIIPLM